MESYLVVAVIGFLIDTQKLCLLLTKHVTFTQCSNSKFKTQYFLYTTQQCLIVTTFYST